MVSGEQYCWQISSRKKKCSYGVFFLLICVGIFSIDLQKNKQTLLIEYQSPFAFSSDCPLGIPAEFAVLFVCSLLVFRPAFHHPSHYKAEYKIIPSAAWQRASFLFIWMMQLYQYLPNSGTLNAYTSDDIWYCCIIAEKWITLPHWVLFSCPTQQVSNADNSGRARRLKTNPDCSTLLVLPSFR